MGEVDRKGYPQDVTDEEWAFVLPYLLLSRKGPVMAASTRCC